jgi:nucleotide-binding universal stress UspA family protein
MTEQQLKSVVVAVGPEPGEAALAFAAEEARSAGCGLHLVHVVQMVAQGPDTVLISPTDVQSLSRALMATAVERAEDLVGPGVQVTSEIMMGGVVRSLVDVARRRACMVVFQHRELSRARRVVTRSVSSGVAAHTRVPVVSVPSDWRPGETGSVTVGVDVAERAEHVLRAALHTARTRGATVRVLHTWSLPGGYDDIPIGPTEREERSRRARNEIQALLDGLGEELAGVPVEIEARQGHAADDLVAASRTTDLVVVGRHDPLVPIGSHLGPVARAVLREAHCPVLLAEPRPGHRWHRHARVGEQAVGRS